VCELASKEGGPVLATGLLIMDRRFDSDVRGCPVDVASEPRGVEGGPNAFARGPIGVGRIGDVIVDERVAGVHDDIAIVRFDNVGVLDALGIARDDDALTRDGNAIAREGNGFTCDRKTIACQRDGFTCDLNGFARDGRGFTREPNAILALSS